MGKICKEYFNLFYEVMGWILDVNVRTYEKNGDRRNAVIQSGRRMQNDGP
jgi:hypothetical protein